MKERGRSSERDSVWNNEALEGYLLQTSRNSAKRNFCLPQQDFPKRIDLSSAWHDTFEVMRRETQSDWYERWRMVAVTEDRKRLVFWPPYSVCADPAPIGINPYDMEFELEVAKAEGVPYWAADIYAYPSSGGGGRRFVDDNFLGPELARLLSNRTLPAVMFLVGLTQNAIAFRTQESELIPDSFDPETFDLFWIGPRKRRDRNFKIAKRHSLVFYEGKTRQPFLRIYP